MLDNTKLSLVSIYLPFYLVYGFAIKIYEVDDISQKLYQLQTTQRYSYQSRILTT